jgi:hypothetical protein
MTLNSNHFPHSHWEIRAAEKGDLHEVAQWIEAASNGRSLSVPVLAASLSGLLESHGKDDRTQHIVGIRDGRLIFYFNGFPKNRFGIASQKLLKKKDYSLWLVTNVLLPDHKELCTEIWLRALAFVFRDVSIGRVITEVDSSALDYVASMRRVGFQEISDAKVSRSLVTWYACNRLDFSYMAVF